VIEIFFLVSSFVYEFRNVAKRNYESGNLESPPMIITGAHFGIILLAAISTRVFDISDHPLVTFCSSLFILIFTFAPLTGLGLRPFKRIIEFLKEQN